jgi:hypothetical protein
MIARPLVRDLVRRLALSSASSPPPLPEGFFYIRDDDGNYVVDDTGNYVIYEVLS